MPVRSLAEAVSERRRAEEVERALEKPRRVAPPKAQASRSATARTSSGTGKTKTVLPSSDATRLWLPPHAPEGWDSAAGTARRNFLKALEHEAPELLRELHKLQGQARDKRLADLHLNVDWMREALLYLRPGDDHLDRKDRLCFWLPSARITGAMIARLQRRPLACGDLRWGFPMPATWDPFQETAQDFHTRVKRHIAEITAALAGLGFKQERGQRASRAKARPAPIEDRFRWLVRFQVLGCRQEDIAEQNRVSMASVSEAVGKVAESIGLPLRPADHRKRSG